MGTVMLFGVAVPVIELIIGVVGLLAVLGLFGFAMFMAFVGMPMMQTFAISQAFPLKVKGWKTRLAGSPPFDATVEDVRRMNQLILKHGLTKGYKKRDLKTKINNCLVRWVPADPQFDGKRAVVDPHGRRVPVLDDKGRPKVDANGQPVTKPMLVAGWHSGNLIHVVYVEDDKLHRTAYAHEVGHEIHELKGLVDYKHKDQDMWGKDGIVPSVRAEMRAELDGTDPKEPLDDGIEVGAA